MQLEKLSPEELLNFTSTQVVGRQLLFETPFGRKLRLYVDFTASGQDAHFVADLVKRIEELYSNTHMETSITGAYSSKLLLDAKMAVLQSLKGDPERYLVMGQGMGCCWAIEQTQKLLGTYIPGATRKQLAKAFGSWENVKKPLREQGDLPLVVLSHVEHLANETSWRNQLCDVVVCPGDIDGQADVEALEKILLEHRPSRKTIIGSFTASSNLTGIRMDLDGIAKTLKKYGALFFLDYAATSPYDPIDLSQTTSDGRLIIDGLYISPHKFIGGPGASGICVFNRACFEPTAAVAPNWRKDQLMTDEMIPISPGITQIIKAGLAFRLKSLMQDAIEAREHRHLVRFREAVKNFKNFKLLGPEIQCENRVGIVAFKIFHNDRMLHHNFVGRLFNDIFGIQCKFFFSSIKNSNMFNFFCFQIFQLLAQVALGVVHLVTN